MAAAHQVDFRILGTEMQFVEVELDPGESAVAEAGSMMYMTPGIEMETIFGDGSGQQRSGVMGALLGAGKRLITGESLFMTVFTNQGSGKQQVAFAAPYPGKILSMDLKELGGELICQKDSFLCAPRRPMGSRSARMVSACSVARVHQAGLPATACRVTPAARSRPRHACRETLRSILPACGAAADRQHDIHSWKSSGALRRGSRFAT